MSEFTEDLPTTDWGGLNLAKEASEHLAAVQQAVREYRQQGVSVVRLRADGDKKPLERGWTTRSAEAEDFLPDENVGLVCGYPSTGGKEEQFLVNIDVDSPEAVEKADKFLPATGALEGRPSSPRSHWWYFVTDVPDWATSEAKQAVAAATSAGKHPGPFTKSLRHRDTKKEVLKFIGTGGQTAAPPSLHAKSGETRRWEEGYSFEKIATVSFITLWEAACQLAESCGAKIPAVGPEAVQGVDDEVDVDAASELGVLVGQVQGTCTRNCNVPMEERERRCERYLQAVELARSEHGGHDTTYRVARIICNDFAVTNRDSGIRLMHIYNERLREGGEEPWSEDGLEHKLDDALKALNGPDDPKYPFGGKLNRQNREPDAPRWNDPSWLADAFVRQWPVLFYSGRYFVFNGRNYEEVDASTLKAQVWAFIESQARQLVPDAPPKVSRMLRDGVVAAIEARGVTPLKGRSHEVAFNAWLPGTGRSGDTLVVRNGLLDVASGELSAHTPDFLGLYCLPYDFDPNATCPTWEKAVDRICGADTDLKKLIQQWFGYCLTRSTDQQKFMVLVGEGANGKSTLVGGLLAVIGEANASHVALEKFSGSFDLGYTLGKLVNVPDDMSEIDKANEGVLKTYTSGGAMAFNQKNRPILSARPTAKLMFSTNTVPRFTDRSSGLWRRLLLVPLNVVIPEAERVKGMDKPSYWEGIGEVAGMLNWALAGLRSLAESNAFIVPAVVVAAGVEHQTESNPARAFIEEFLEEAEGQSIPSRNVYAAYRTWMEMNGQHALSHTQFTRELRRLLPSVTRATQSRKGKPIKVLQGIRWTELYFGWEAQIGAPWRTAPTTEQPDAAA